MKNFQVVKITLSALLAAVIVAVPFSSYAKLSEDTKYEDTSETFATDEEWALETDTTEFEKGYEEPEDITACLNTKTIVFDNGLHAVKRKGTVYVPMRQFFTDAGFEFGFNNITGKITLKAEGSEASFNLYSKKCTVNGEEYKLDNRIAYIHGCLYAPAEVFSLTMNAKVWFDENGKTFTVSTGKYKNDEVLRIVNGKLYMNGEPYYEISFNKFDLCYQIHAGYYHNHEWPEKKFQSEAAEDALALLNSLGFKSIRVFMNSTYRRQAMSNDEDMAAYMKAMDDVFDLCDKYDVKLVVCMNLFDGAFCAPGETWVDMMGDLGSESFANVKRYVEMFVERYKDRKSVLMWEITNEGNLEADLKKISARQIGNFYAALTNVIHDIDSEHLVTGGDSVLRSSQWHMYESSRHGGGGFWGIDNLMQRFMAYRILYHGIDVISIHPYGVGIGTDYHYLTDNPMDGVKNIDFDYLAYEAKVMGKPLYNGEAAVNADNPPEDNTLNDNYLNMIIDAGIQITHWWTFHTDRQGFHDGYGWDITYGDLLDSIVKANKKIKELYCVNGCENANVESPVTERIFEAKAETESLGAITDFPVTVPAAAILIIAAVFLTAVKINKKKKKEKAEEK